MTLRGVLLPSEPATIRDPANPLWWGGIALRVITYAFAVGVVVVHRADYDRLWLAWSVLAAMAVWTALTALAYARPKGRQPWLVVTDVTVSAVLMLTSPWVLSDDMYLAGDPLITTVWVPAAVVFAGARFGAAGGAAAGLVIAVGTGLARQVVDVDVVRDGVLLVASGLIIGMSANALRRATVVMARALRHEAATAERERLARSIHDSVLQVLARVRRRGSDLGGEASELARLAGEQEIALRALVASVPSDSTGNGAPNTTDLRGQLQLLASPEVTVSTPAGEVRLPTLLVSEVTAAVRESLHNVERHAGERARAWVLLEDLGGEVVVSVRDDGPGIPPGRLERAESEGRLGVAQSIKNRISLLGGTIRLDTAPGAGTEWEFRVPRPSGAQ